MKYEDTKKTMLDFALQYLQRGASIMPVGRNKIPLVSWTEFQNRLPTEEEVTDWWTKWPEANIGVITGKISNITVVDVEAGGDITRFPETDTIRTGGGGWHLYYAYTPFTNKARIFPLTDVRGDGGYVVAPPSVHQSGQKYVILKTVGKKPFPIHLFGEEKKSKWDFSLLNGVGSGSRNQSAAQVAGKLLTMYPPAKWEEAFDFLKAWNIRNNPPMSDWELRSVFSSIARREAKKYPDAPKLEQAPRITMTDVVQMASKELLATNPKDVVSFGYNFLDDKMTGLFPGELLVVGGESGIGKTSLTTNMVMKNSKKYKCMIFALEDRLVYYGKKAIYFEIGKLRRRDSKPHYRWNDFAKNAIVDPVYPEYHKRAIEELKNENIEFFQSDELITTKMLGEILEKKVQEGVELFLIDHLHYFDFGESNASKADRVEKTMVEIKNIQNKTGARIILVVHYRKLNSQKPTLDSFKDSISIVQNANYVLNIWRDRRQGEKIVFTDKINTEFYIAKARNPNGEGTLKVMYDRQENDYTLLDEQHGAPQEDKGDYSEVNFD